jgi:Na+:H+ antiporter, NhaA family
LAGKDFNEYVKLETYSAVLLFVAAILALIIDNTSLSQYYDKILYSKHSLDFGAWHLGKHSILLWVNDGLMTLFFLLVGLEMKREMSVGELRSVSQIMLPIVAALGGMFIPVLIFFMFIHSGPELNGWAIPIATDIAFSLGVLSLLGKRIPPSLKVFLTALAIFDDMGAVIVIAIFHTHNISQLFLFLSLLLCIVLWVLNRNRVYSLWPYLLVGLLLWVFVLKSGIHPTLAGIAVAFSIPLRCKGEKISPLKKLESNLHLWVAFGVLPLFAFVNAGVSFIGLTWSQFFNSLSLGIAAGLFLGKQIGITGFSYLFVKLKFAKLPQNVSFLQLYGVSLLAGMGFTMSLFIGNLAFDESLMFEPNVRIGVLLGSLLSGLAGYLVLLFSAKKELSVYK